MNEPLTGWDVLSLLTAFLLVEMLGTMTLGGVFFGMAAWCIVRWLSHDVFPSKRRQRRNKK